MSDDLIASLEAAYAEGKTLAWGLCKPAAARIRELEAERDAPCKGCANREEAYRAEAAAIARADRAEAERDALRLMVRENAAWAQENEALAAKLARCEAMLVEGKGQIAACGNQGLVRRIDAYFAEQEPRT